MNWPQMRFPRVSGWLTTCLASLLVSDAIKIASLLSMQ
jgi:hypothetical protein